MTSPPAVLYHAFADAPFGRVLLAATQEGLCGLYLVTDEATALTALQAKYPRSNLLVDNEHLPGLAACLFSRPNEQAQASVVLHVKGTPFQRNVWAALLTIPFGETRSYGWVAERIGHPKATRAVGTAVGANPLCFVVPCHRVIRSDGSLGQYFWGPEVKAHILTWERHQ